MEIFGKPLKTRVTRNRVTRIRVTRGLAVCIILQNADLAKDDAMAGHNCNKKSLSRSIADVLRKNTLSCKKNLYIYTALTYQIC